MLLRWPQTSPHAGNRFAPGSVLVRFIDHAGFPIEGRASKVISDALRWEARRGRAVVDDQKSMPFAVRNPGEAFRILTTLAEADVNLLAFNIVPLGPESTQLVIFRMLGEMPGLTDNNREKAALVLEGQENLIRLIKKYDITTGFGTDLINSAYKRLPREFTERAQYWTPAEVLRRENGVIVIQGMELGRAFSIVVSENLGSMSASIAAEDLTVSVFGACTPLQTGR